MNDKKKDKKINYPNLGIAAGSIMTGMGGTMVGGGKLLEKISTSKPGKRLTQEQIDKVSKKVAKGLTKDAKSKGAMTAIAGGSLLAASAIKKKKDANKKK